MYYFILIALDCPSGMTYQQCGPQCLHLCTSDITSNCYGGCAEGCFCPYGQVWYNNKCIDPIACPGWWSVLCTHNECMAFIHMVPHVHLYF